MDQSAKKYASGVVLDTAKSEPVNGAIVKIIIDGPVPTSSGNNWWYRKEETNESGRFNLFIPVPNRYEKAWLEVEASGYEPYRSEIVKWEGLEVMLKHRR